MRSIEDLRQLFAFNDWANRRVIAVLRESGCVDGLKLMSHVVTTETEYFERIHGKDSTGFDFWPDLDLEGVRDAALRNAESYRGLLEQFDEEGLGQSIDYRTSSGTGVRGTFRDLLTHVVFHSMAHRGQILTELRRSGVEPPKIDYIIYRREVQ